MNKHADTIIKMKKKEADQNQFIKLDVKKLKHIEAERKRLLPSGMQGMPDMHTMRCPRCSRQFEKKTVTDIAIVICAQCKGIWLDAESFTKVLRLFGDMADNFLNHATK